MDTIITIRGCHPSAFATISQRAEAGIKIVSHKPVGQSGRFSLVDIEIGIGCGVPVELGAARSVDMLKQCGSTAKLYIGKQHVPGDETTIARRLEAEKRAEKV